MSKPMDSGGTADLLARPLAEISTEELAQLFTTNAKPSSKWMIGLELELFGYLKKDRSQASHAEIVRVLEALGAHRSMDEEREVNGALIGLKGGGTIVSLEPGGQLEFATKPYRPLKGLRDELKGYVQDLSAVADELGIGFWALGHHPFESRDSSARMPKPRYDCMRRYFAKRGRRALDMMHLTSSVQCTVDFSDEENLTNKVRTAALASPFISALVAASPFTQGKKNGFKTVRYQIWLETDDQRCGLWPEMLDDEGLSVRRYLDKALQTPSLFVVRDDVHHCTEPLPYIELARQGFRGTTVTGTDFLDHLTTFFPEIRPKGYVELRGADCVPVDSAVAIAGVWRGLLDDEDTRCAVDERLRAIDFAELRLLQAQVARLGLEAHSRAGLVRDVTQWLVELAHTRLAKGAPDCAECLLPLLERAQRGRSPADDMLECASIEDALDRWAGVA